jgi:hypothetical protein
LRGTRYGVINLDKRIRPRNNLAGFSGHNPQGSQPLNANRVRVVFHLYRQGRGRANQYDKNIEGRV